MHIETLEKRPLTTCTPDETRSDLRETHPVVAANSGARSGPRPSDPDFTWMLAEKSIPTDVGENFWGV